MPMMHEMPDTESLLKLLLIGESKAGKTPWAGLAGLNYKVLYLDGDVGIQSLNKLPPEAKKNLAYIPCQDYVNENGKYVSRFAEFFTAFLTEGVLTWNDSRSEVFQRKDYVFGESTDTIWQIRPARMDHSAVLIVDSWTALVQSVMQWKADDLSVDLGDVEKVSREIYAGVGNKLTQYLTLIRGFPCHVIVIAHPDEYVKLEKPLGKIGSMKETEMKIQWTKMVPKSSSKPHALTMAKFFSDVGWLDTAPNGDTQLDFRPATDRIIGGHTGERHSAKATTVAEIVAAIGGHVPTQVPSSDSWLTIFPDGSFEPAGGRKPIVLGASPKPAASATVNPEPGSGTAPTQVVKGLSGLFAKKEGVEPGMKK